MISKMNIIIIIVMFVVLLVSHEDEKERRIIVGEREREGNVGGGRKAFSIVSLRNLDSTLHNKATSGIRSREDERRFNKGGCGGVMQL